MSLVTPTIRGSVYSAQANSTTCSVTTTGSGSTIPQAGDKVIVFHTNNVSTLANMTTPTGGLTWTLVDSSDAGSSLAHNKAWSATLGSTGNFTVTANQSVSGFMTVHVYVIPGAANVNAFGHNTSVNATLIAQADGVTTTSVNTLLLLGMSVTPDTGIATDASGYTRGSLQRMSTTHMGITYYRNVAATGATGLAQTTLSANKASIASISLAMTPSDNVIAVDPMVGSTALIVNPSVYVGNTALGYREDVRTTTNVQGYYETNTLIGNTLVPTIGSTNALVGVNGSNTATVGVAGPNGGYYGIQTYPDSTNPTEAFNLASVTGPLTGNFSFEGWFKINTSTSSGTLFYAQPATTGSTFVVSLNSGQVEAVYGTCDAITTGTTINDNTWKHIVVIWNGAAVLIYINGSLIASSSGSRTVAGNSTMSLGVGGDTPTQPMLVSNVAWYNAALSGTAITRHKNAMTSVSLVPNPMIVDALIVMPTVLAQRNISNIPAVMTGSTASLVMPTVLAQRVINIAVDPMTASALMAQPGITAGSSTSISASVMTASATMPGGYSASVVVTAAVATASASLVMPAYNAGFSRVIAVDPMRANAYILPNTEFAGKDRYYNNIIASVDLDDVWLRFLETSGPRYVDEVDKIFSTPAGGVSTGVNQYYGSQTFQVTAPADRVGVQFGSTDYMLINNLASLAPNAPGTIELLIKIDSTSGTIFSGGDGVRFTRLRVENGYLVYEWQGSNSISGQPDTIKRIFNSSVQLNDGQFHHIVITNWWRGLYEQLADNDSTSRKGTALFIDGKLNARQDTPQIFAMPYRLGGDGFQGTFAQLAARYGYTMPKYAIEQNYYAAFGIEPIRVTPMVAGADITNARGRGNVARVLALSFMPTIGYGSGRWSESQAMSTGYGAVYSGRVVGANTPLQELFEGKQIFTKSVALQNAYRDPVTDQPRLFNPMTDVDITEYDAIAIYDVPNPRQLSETWYISEQEARVNIENYIASLKRTFVEKDVSMYIASPETARLMGIIGEYNVHEVVSEGRVVGPRPAGHNGINQNGLYDWFGAKNDPWANPTHANPGDGFGKVSAWDYLDLHRSTQYRIAALEQDLTNMPGYTTAENIFHVYYDPFFRGGSDGAARLDSNSSGLQIGQHITYDGDLAGYPEEFLHHGGRVKVSSVPPANILAGRVIAKESAYDYIGSSRVDNPYKENATVIILKEGDSIGGSTVRGRVFCDFNESMFLFEHTNIDAASETDSDEKKLWQSSTYRSGAASVGISSSGAAQPPASGTPAGQQTGTNANPPAQGVGTGLFMPVFADVPQIRVSYGAMPIRGWHWLLSTKVQTDENDAVVQVGTMDASGVVVQPTTSAARSVTIGAQPMLATALIKPTQETTGQNIGIAVLPMLANARMVHVQTVIKVEPMLANAELVDNFNARFAQGTQIEVTFYRTANKDIILYSKEEN